MVFKNLAGNLSHQRPTTLPTLATTVIEVSMIKMIKYASRDLCGFAILSWSPAIAPGMTNERPSAKVAPTIFVLFLSYRKTLIALCTYLPQYDVTAGWGALQS